MIPRATIRGVGNLCGAGTRGGGGGGGGDVHWLGDTTSSNYFADPCELVCISPGLVLTWHGLVADGNRCTNRPDIFDVCIAGKCQVRMYINKFE